LRTVFVIGFSGVKYAQGGRRMVGRRMIRRDEDNTTRSRVVTKGRPGGSVREYERHRPLPETII